MQDRARPYLLYISTWGVNIFILLNFRTILTTYNSRKTLLEICFQLNFIHRLIGVDITTLDSKYSNPEEEHVYYFLKSSFTS